jgi:ligand-binding SRPBCC domain-containing protein
MITRNNTTPTSYKLSTELWLPADPEDVFAYFSDADNLDAITPPWLGFRILTPRPIEMRTGTLIDYRLRLHAIPIHWQTEITAWEPPHRFVDSQRRGPYRFWRHEHTFVPSRGGTLVCDDVHYSILGGRVIHRFFVRSDLESIFEFRHQRLRERFGAKAMN